MIVIMSPVTSKKGAKNLSSVPHLKNRIYNKYFPFCWEELEKDKGLGLQYSRHLVIFKRDIKMTLTPPGRIMINISNILYLGEFFDSEKGHMRSSLRGGARA